MLFCFYFLYHIFRRVQLFDIWFFDDLFRRTGIQAPKNVSRDSGGNERAEEFFNNAGSNNNDQDQEEEEEVEQQQQQTKSQRSSPSRSKTIQSQSQNTQSNGDGGNRRKERPDKYAEIGERGRLVFISF